MVNSQNIPLIIAGPQLRHLAKNKLSIWYVSRELIDCKPVIQEVDAPTKSQVSIQGVQHIHWQLGEKCFINLLSIDLDSELAEKQRYTYDLTFTYEGKASSFAQELPEMCYSGYAAFSFKFVSQLENVLHGSCRKAHYPEQDSLPQLANLVAPDANDDLRPDIVLFTGDQVYVDDVAGPMLHAIQQVIQALGLFEEEIQGSKIQNSKELIGHPDCFYQRQNLLPETEINEDLEKVFFKGKKKPVFTSVNAQNHLIALNEMIALYLLSWSSRLWSSIDLSAPDIATEFQPRYASEKVAIENFCKGLSQVEKALAHVPVYMIFDDHDVTDDWNLTRAWEEQVYNNPYSKQIIGNALAAYFLCQGIGNPIDHLTPMIEIANKRFVSPSKEQHQLFIDKLLAFDHWHYQLQTDPPVQVLDTRTQRWRSESNPNKPSGLMDWEALCELQQNVIGKESVILVSAAPIYGIKFIETIQRIFTFFGGALMVDAENWMAHKGTANVMLNIFTHKSTPPHFTILSGDVHYSFVYDVSLRFRRNSPKILQFTCSGIHNAFPEGLIKWFDRFNRLLYGHRSPLNFLTKRRNMSIKQRDPDNTSGEIVNKCAMGLLTIDRQTGQQECKLILADGSTIQFRQHE